MYVSSCRRWLKSFQILCVEDPSVVRMRICYLNMAVFTNKATLLVVLCICVTEKSVYSLFGTLPDSCCRLGQVETAAEQNQSELFDALCYTFPLNFMYLQSLIHICTVCIQYQSVLHQLLWLSPAFQVFTVTSQ